MRIMRNNPAGTAAAGLREAESLRRTGRIVCAALALMLAFGLGSCAAEGARLRVYASFYPMGDFAGKIGGDRVQIEVMVPSGMEPHDWEPTPRDIAGLEGADVFVYSGAGMEHWVGDVLGSLGNRGLTIVEASAGVALLGGDGLGHGDRGHDPHVWLDPMNAKVQMASIRDGLSKADPANASYYQANYERCAAELEALDAEFRQALAPLQKRDIVVAHAAYGYLCAAYGLNQVAIEGLSPDSEPDPSRVAEIIDFGRERGVRVIFFEELVSPKVAEAIASAVGAKTCALSPLEGLSDREAAAGDDYFSVMRRNLAAIAAALE